MEWEPAPGEPARVICRKAQLFSKSLLELLHRKNLPGMECPLLAHSGHWFLHRTCPLSGVKRTFLTLSKSSSAQTIEPGRGGRSATANKIFYSWSIVPQRTHTKPKGRRECPGRERYYAPFISSLVARRKPTGQPFHEEQPFLLRKLPQAYREHFVVGSS